MEVFRELLIRGTPAQLASTLSAIESSLADGWSRCAVPRIAGVSMLTMPSHGFACARAGRRPAATLFIAEKSPELLYVSNIVPQDERQLGYGDYNRILEEFCQRFVRPSAERTGVAVELTDAQAELEHWLSPAAAEKLRNFSAQANRSTGSAHPIDHERWMDFLVAAHRESSNLDGVSLRRWLIETEGWPTEVAVQLVSEYEIGRDVLAYSELRRGA